jgi:3-hydroxy-D-aspartate aldolase
VTTSLPVEIAKAAAAPGSVPGLQAYQGAMQHMDKYEDRKAKLDRHRQVRRVAR